MTDTLLPETTGSLKNNGQQMKCPYWITPCVQGQAVCFKDHLLEIKHLIEINAKHGMFREESISTAGIAHDSLSN